MLLRPRILIPVILFLVIIGGGYFGYNWYSNRLPSVRYKTPEESDVYVRFGMEAYDKILQNYWNKSKDEDMAELYRLSIVKAASTSPESVTLPSKDRTGAAKMLYSELGKLSDSDKKQFIAQTVNVAMYNLPPYGRNGLLSKGQETQLRNDEKNINPAVDLYKDVGVEKGSSPDVVAQKYEEKKAELENIGTPEAKAELEKVTYAARVLSDEAAKTRYDQNKAEPTVFPKIIGGKTLYVYVSRVSPTTLQEFGEILIEASTSPQLTSLIVDLRGNIGGTLDFAKYFLGMFLGQNQYAFDLFHQDEYKVERTVMPKITELSKYREAAVLTDSMTQSTAELISVAFKKFRLGTVVGTPTRGWGTVENTFPMETIIDPNESYVLLIVHSITLRDDGQPIEGRGVDPDVNINEQSWEESLSNFIRLPELVRAVRETASISPIRI